MKLYEIRKALHQIPELGRKEYKTKEFIIEFAKTLDCKIFEPTPTGVVLYFDVQKKHTICFRADMDGLPIEEQTNLEFQSKHLGCMHACGHDGHMAMLLSFAEWANQNKNKLTSNMVCLFQPSEEDNAGARDILKSNILEELNVERIFGMHIWPNLEEGKLFTMSGGMLATSGEVTIRIHGKSVHAANKAEGIDALWIGTELIHKMMDFEKTISEPHLIHFGKFSAGTVRNAIASEAVIEATMRAYSDEVFYKMKQTLEELIFDYEQAYKAKIECIINVAYPSVINDSNLVKEYQSLLKYDLLKQPYLQAEDFGCYTRKYPSLFLLLGCGDKHLLHTNTFDFSMDILQVGLDAYKKISMK